MNFTQRHMAKKYGYRRRLITDALSASWEQFWTCRVLRRHQQKMDSHGACYRCARATRPTR